MQATQERPTHRVFRDVVTGERWTVDLRPDPLMQTETWTTAAGETMALAEMTPQHVERVIALMRLWAPRLHRRAIARMMEWEAGPFGPGGDVARDSFDREFDALLDAEPRVWIDETPLICALKAELILRFEPWGVAA